MQYATQMRCIVPVFLFIAGSYKALSAEPEFRGLSNRLNHAESIDRLPGHVPTTEGELSLFAEFDGIRGDGVVLYLVNLTPHRIGFSSQDGDPYVKLEALTPSGEWERAQTHQSSWCGNSYMVIPSLRPGEFFRFLGYRPADGEPRTVRYRVFRDTAFILNDLNTSKPPTIPINLLSNVGAGFARRADIEGARRDGLAIPYGSFETVRDLAVAGFTDALGRPQGSDSAIEALGRFPTEESLALLRGFLEDPDRSKVEAAMRALAKMGLRLESAETFYQELLQSDDSAVRATALFAMAERPFTHEAIRFAEQQLSHDDLMVRVMAMSLLARHCKEDSGTKARINALYDSSDPKIRSVFETVRYPTCINYQERERAPVAP